MTWNLKKNLSCNFVDNIFGNTVDNTAFCQWKNQLVVGSCIAGWFFLSFKML